MCGVRYILIYTCCTVGDGGIANSDLVQCILFSTESSVRFFLEETGELGGGVCMTTVAVRTVFVLLVYIL